MSTSDPLTSAILRAMSQWAFSLPIIAVWIAGIVFALGRRRRNPKVALLVMAACGLSLLAIFVMPVLTQLAFSFTSSAAVSIGVVSMMVSVVWACLAAISSGLLIYAAFVDRPEYGTEMDEERG
jgi:hypothetical protein